MFISKTCLILYQGEVEVELEAKAKMEACSDLLKPEQAGLLKQADKYVIVTIDAEFADYEIIELKINASERNKELYLDEKDRFDESLRQPLKILRAKTGFVGLLYPDYIDDRLELIYEHYDINETDRLIIKLIELSKKHKKKVLVNTFFNMAELQFLLKPLLQECRISRKEQKSWLKTRKDLHLISSFKIQDYSGRLKARQIQKSLHVLIHVKPDIEIEIRDFKIISSLDTLERGLELFDDECWQVLLNATNFATKDEFLAFYRRWKEQRAEMSQHLHQNLDEVLRYNKADCYVNHLSYLRFLEIMHKSLNISHADAVTLGSGVSRYISQLIADEEWTQWNYLIYQANAGRQEYLEYKAYTAIQQALVQSYYGGGKILTPLPIAPVKGLRVIDGVYQKDFFSLYPNSALYALSYCMPASMKEIQLKTISSTEFEELVKDDGTYFFAYVKYDQSELNMPILATQTEHGLLYLQQNYTWLCKDEVVVLKEYDFYNRLKIEPVQVLYWKIQDTAHEHAGLKRMRLFIKELLQRRHKTDNQAERLVIKMVLNILYGKTAEKRVNKILSNYLFATLITGISRAFMMKAMFEVWRQDGKVYHLATDSLITDVDIKVRYEKLARLLDLPEDTDFLKLECSGRLYYKSNKFYKISSHSSHSSDSNDSSHNKNKNKLAVLAVPRIDRELVFKQLQKESGGVYVWNVDSYVGLKRWCLYLDAGDGVIVNPPFNPAEMLTYKHVFVDYRPDRFFNDAGRLFSSIEEFKRWQNKHHKMKQYIKMKAIATGRLYNPVTDSYEDLPPYLHERGLKFMQKLKQRQAKYDSTEKGRQRKEKYYLKHKALRHLAQEHNIDYKLYNIAEIKQQLKEELQINDEDLQRLIDEKSNSEAKANAKTTRSSVSIELKLLLARARALYRLVTLNS